MPSAPPSPPRRAGAPTRALRRELASRGYQEIVSYSFVDPLRRQRLDASPAAPIRNPLSSGTGELRTGLWCGLLDAAQRNRNRQRRRMLLFERGRCFRPAARGGVVESDMLAGLAAGARHPESWSHGDEALDFYDVKADLAALPGIPDCDFEPTAHRALRPGRAACVLQGDRVLGEFGELHPALADRWELKGPVFLFQLRLDDWPPPPRPTISPPSRFPSVRRDLALVAPEALPAKALLAAVRAAAGEVLRDSIVMDIYRDAAALGGPNRYGIALGLVFQRPDRTMKDAEITCIINNIINILQKDLQVALRT